MADPVLNGKYIIELDELTSIELDAWLSFQPDEVSDEAFRISLENFIAALPVIPAVAGEYADIAALLTAQPGQTIDVLYRVINPIADPAFNDLPDAEVKSVYYHLPGAKNGLLSDYNSISFPKLGSDKNTKLGNSLDAFTFDIKFRTAEWSSNQATLQAAANALDLNSPQDLKLTGEAIKLITGNDPSDISRVLFGLDGQLIFEPISASKIQSDSSAADVTLNDSYQEILSITGNQDISSALANIGLTAKSFATGSITAFADAGDGRITVTSATHGLSEGQFVEIVNTSNYDGIYEIKAVPNINDFDITKAFVSTETGDWEISANREIAVDLRINEISVKVFTRQIEGEGRLNFSEPITGLVNTEDIDVFAKSNTTGEAIEILGTDQTSELKVINFDGNVESNTWYVNPSASGGDGSPQNPYTVDESMAAASEGDVIFFQPGTYTDDITVTKDNLTFVGYNLDVCKIDVTNFVIDTDAEQITLILDNLDIDVTNALTQGTNPALVTFKNINGIFSGGIVVYRIEEIIDSFIGSSSGITTSSFTLVRNSTVFSGTWVINGTSSFQKATITGTISAAGRTLTFNTCDVTGDVNCANLTYKNTVITGTKVGTSSTTVNNQTGGASDTTYDASGEIDGNVPDTPTEVQSALKESRDWINTPLNPLGDFAGGSILIDRTGIYNVKTLAANLAITFDDAVNQVEGNTKLLYLIGNGTHTITITANDIPVIFDGFTNGGALSASVVHRFAFTYFNDYIDTDYTLKSIIELDTSPPTFTIGPSSANITDVDFDITATLNENGTVYVVVVADGASAPTSSEVKAGTGSGGSGELATGNDVDSGSGVTINLSGLSASTDYDAYVVAEDLIPNLQVSPTLVNVSTTAGVSILESDDFTGTTIDTGKWTVTDPADTVDISQDDELIFTTDGTSSVTWSANNVKSKFNIPESSFATAIDSVSISGGDIRNRGFVLASAAGSTIINLRAIVGDEVDVFFRDSLGATIINLTVTATAFEGKTWRISIVSNVLKVSYWNGSSWTDIESVSTGGNIDTDLLAQLRCGDETGDSAGTVIFDNFYITDDVYSTQYP